VSEKATSISPGEWAVLGLLAEEPRHGFALVKAMDPDGDIGRVWSLPRPLVYRALSTLRAKGLVSVVGAERSELGPQRLLMAPTQEGQDQLLSWLWAPVEHLRDVRSLLMLKLALLARRGDDPKPLLEAQAERFAPLVRVLEQRANDAGGGFDGALMLWRLESARSAMRFLKRAPGVVGATVQPGRPGTASGPVDGAGAPVRAVG
jgi:DNA-binding PadR family transcriptional regulator